jgi:hypothetical protein
MKRVAALALVAITIIGNPSRADILSPGTKWIKHSVVIDNLKDLPDYEFFTYATFQNHTAPIQAGKPLSIGNGNPLNAVLVIGIPRDKLEALGGKPQEAWFASENRRGAPGDLKLPEGVVVSSSEVPHHRAIKQADPTEHIITHLNIALKPKDDAGVKGSARLILKVVSEERLDKAGKPLQPKKEAETKQQEKNDEASVAGPAPVWLWAGIPLAAIAGIVFIAIRKRTPAQA